MNSILKRPRSSLQESDADIRILSGNDNTDSTASLRQLAPRLRQWLRPSIVERLVLASDALLIVITGVASAFGYRWYADSLQIDLTTYATAATLIAVNFILLVKVQHGYRLKNIEMPMRQIQMTITTWLVVFAVLMAAVFAMKLSQDFSRGAVMTFFALGLIVLLTARTAAAVLISRALSKGQFTNSRIVVVAEQGLASSSWSLNELRQQGYRPARILEISSKDLSSPLMMSTINTRFNALIGYCREHKIEQVFLLFNWNTQHVIDSVLDALKVLPVSVHLIPDASVARYLKYPAISAGDTWTAELRRSPLSKGEQVLKRTFDICSSLAAIVLFAPIMLITAILIKYDSNGPVLFRQTRNGFNGRSFRIYKFRTMKVADDGPTIVQARKNDSRVTTIGRWLRKTSIDELPQLLNVLQGDMSLVGPRPHAAAHNTEYEQLIGNYAFRHHVKPGITGWAQVNGYRGETDAIALMEKRVEFDLWYINNWSFFSTFQL